MKLKQHLIPVLIFTAIALLFLAACLIPMIRSDYASAVPEALQMFMVNFLCLYIVYAGILFLNHFVAPDKTMMTMSFLLMTLLLQSGNSVSLPLLEYVSGRELSEATGMAQDYLKYTIIFLGSSAFSMGLMAAAPAILLRKQKVTVILSGVMNLILAGILFVFHGDYGTTTIADIQVGLPILAYMLVIFAFYWHVFHHNRSTTRSYFPHHPHWAAILHYASLAALLGGYALSKELGIPFFFVMACVLWIMFYSNKKGLKRFIPLVISGAVIGAALIYYNVAYKPLTDEEAQEAQQTMGVIMGMIMDVISSLCAKLHDRVFELAPQSQTAIERVHSAGLFGAMDYRLLGEARTDFSIVTNTHFLGGVWLVSLLMLIGAVAVFSNMFFRKHENTRRMNVLPSLGLTMIFCLCLWNIISNLGLIGMVGVSCYASGYGKTVYILSGMLFGFVMYPTDINRLLFKGKSGKTRKTKKEAVNV